MSAPVFTSEPIKKIKLLPIYIMCDVSSSMGWPEEAREKPIDAINSGIEGVLRALREQSHVAGEIELSIISFGSRSEVVLPLTRVDAETYVAPLKAGGTTNLRLAFDTLSATLDLDYHAIRDRGAIAYRPAVFLFTDGVPTGDDGYPTTDHESWLAPLGNLKDHPVWAPRIFAYGFGDADKDLLGRMVEYKKMPDHIKNDLVNFSSEDAVESIKRIFPALFGTIVEGAAAAADGVTEEKIGEILMSAQSSTKIVSSPDEFWGS